MIQFSLCVAECAEPQRKSTMRIASVAPFSEAINAASLRFRVETIMFKRLAILLLLLVPAQAAAGVHAIYGSRALSSSIDIRVAENGDFVAEIGIGRGVIHKGSETYLVEQLYTGPRVTRLADITALLVEGSAGQEEMDGRVPDLVSAGPTEVKGRRGEAFLPKQAAAGANARERERERIVVSRDPELALLGPALREIWRARLLQSGLHMEPRQTPRSLERMFAQFPEGAVLADPEVILLSAAQEVVPPEAIAVPADPESMPALKARLADQAPSSPMTNIVRAAFFEGRLWLLTAEGRLFSMADGGGRLRPEEVPGKPVDLCRGPAGIALLEGATGGPWTVVLREGGKWLSKPAIGAQGDRIVALSCEGDAVSLLTTRRFLLVGSERPQVLRLRAALSPALVRAVVHVTPRYVFIGINAVAWSGGLQTIDRRTVASMAIHKMSGAEICGHPLDGACDPVQAVVTAPWQPDCVVAAIGLVHMLSHGRLVSVCGTDVALLYARTLDPHPADADTAAEASVGGTGAVPFYGLATHGREVIALGQDALYQVDEQGRGVRQPFPRFREFDGLLVAFDRPDAILVLTQINRRPSMSGSAPMLVPR